jgi:2-polyprenyl-3-methyl-5-hydroxy-6-metoxy-1,4-benzoquinol methylase
MHDSNQAPGLSSEYVHESAHAPHTRRYLAAPVLDTLSRIANGRAALRIIDVGCGNGAFAAEMRAHGFSVLGIDVSKSGLELARAAHPEIEFVEASVYDDLASKFGKFDVVVSLEVVEHLYSPRIYAARLSSLLDDGGYALLSTPYHGYLKNLALAISGRLDDHFTALWDHGHIKFWSPRTITLLLSEAGFEVRDIRRVGRIPSLAHSMIVTAVKRG